MRKDRLLKITAGMLGCFAIVTLGAQAHNVHLANNVAIEEPIIYTETARFDTKYDFSDEKVLTEHSDLVVIGKVTNLDDATNYNPAKKTYGKARTPGTLEVLQVLKTDSSEKITEVDFLDLGGLISYTEYEKSLLPAQKAKRDYLMQQDGNIKSKSNILVRQTVENQLQIEEGKTYIMYLEYNEDFGKYMVVNQPYGIKEYNVATGKVIDHLAD